MKSSKERKHDRERKAKELSITKSERSHKRRLDNKIKRNEIHAIDPNMKVIIINQRTYDKYGTEIEVVNGKINAISSNNIKDINENINARVEEVKRKEIQKEIGVFNKLASKFNKK